ncbi:hypothetical protein SAMN05444280_1182 [Tangfeifania diversioriginum]|uniref:VWFA domain-containing protein n=1 Tax=Tangfeifania diversioriginum TaxID=1168035 RepID=A0A1M6IV77_9BACT|nr:hypothetical protein [Tangfeifania diversioriginum]SHJ38342.1 hypothetical protein SAMN05444280_1182 [Tangfeifania diversioriginum]
MRRLFIIAIAAFSILSCNNKNSINSNSETEKAVKPQEKQLNISILLDLSDRISPSINSDAQKNDIENIRNITEFFKSNMANLGAYKAKGKIRLFFSPTPSNENINSIVTKLTIDCSEMENKGRKEVYDTLTELYAKNLEKIYQETIATSDWEGSDIWRFFKNDVKDFCIEKDTTYRNILIILTDGYLYHEQSVYNNKNRYTYLLGNSNIKKYRKQNWKELIAKNDFGIKTERNDLNELEVLVLEIRAENSNNKLDEDILRYLWKKWFKEMNVRRYEVYYMDLPANTKTRIDNFLNKAS